MKVYLLYRDRDFDLTREPPPHADALVQDLELASLFGAMSRDDGWLAEVVRKTILASITDRDTIRYRQDILRDCLKNAAVVRDIYDIAVETIEAKRKNYYLGSGRYPSTILHNSVSFLQTLMGLLRWLRTIADRHGSTFESEGFRRLFAVLGEELDDAYFEMIRGHLKRLLFERGVLISAHLGEGNKGANYVLRKDDTPPDAWMTRFLDWIGAQGDWLTRLFGTRPPSFAFRLDPRDESGARALSELRDKGINLVANAAAQSADHVMSFFNMLRTELAFYIGCINLHERLAAQGEPVCFPEPCALDEPRHSATGLYDVCLALNLKRPVVGNDVSADNKDLIIITGANEGGKSTFLRSIGLAQMLMQCGMFVPATAFSANVCERIFTHYKREEDAAMNSGKFDEELNRMSEIVNDLTPNSLVLFNESFAATNEREGSEIARQIVTALIEERVKMFFVTHQYEFAHGMQERNLPTVVFLRAERQAGGARTFKVTEEQPLETSYGEDLYRQIFTGRGA